MALFSWLHPRDRVTTAHIRTIVRHLTHLERLVMAVAPEIQNAIDSYSTVILDAVTAASAAETAEVIAAIQAASEGGRVAVGDVVAALNASRGALAARVTEVVGGIYVAEDGTVTDPGDGDNGTEEPVITPEG